MALLSKSPATASEVRHMSNRWTDQRSPERNKVWIEPRRIRRVPVVYYLCRNGQLEHPHFVEVTLSSPDGVLYLRDVIDRLNSLRGNGMAALYSWSSKRSYKNGFVWHDLAENDFIYPAHGQEYILKGSELFDAGGASFGSKSDDALSTTSIAKKTPSDTPKSVDEFDFSTGRRRNQSWSTIDLHEYKVYSGESSAVRTRIAADASTQTDSNRRRRRELITEAENEDKQSQTYHDNEISELSRNEISPPPSDSSTETLESLMKSDDKLIVRPETEPEAVDVNPTVGSKLKASSVLMQLISCGSMSFRDCGPAGSGKESPGFSVELNRKGEMVPRGEDVDDRVVESGGEGGGENGVVLERKNMGKKMLEDKEYFSGSLIETKKDEFPVLKRSNSYNANG